MKVAFMAAAASVSRGGSRWDPRVVDRLDELVTGRVKRYAQLRHLYLEKVTLVVSGSLNYSDGHTVSIRKREIVWELRGKRDLSSLVKEFFSSVCEHSSEGMKKRDGTQRELLPSTISVKGTLQGSIIDGDMISPVACFVPVENEVYLGDPSHYPIMRQMRIEYDKKNRQAQEINREIVKLSKLLVFRMLADLPDEKKMTQKQFREMVASYRKFFAEIQSPDKSEHPLFEHIVSLMEKMSPEEFDAWQEEVCSRLKE